VQAFLGDCCDSRPGFLTVQLAVEEEVLVELTIQLAPSCMVLQLRPQKANGPAHC
jgi:hypothetical protein